MQAHRRIMGSPPPRHRAVIGRAMAGAAAVLASETFGHAASGRRDRWRTPVEPVPAAAASAQRR
jgi:hypothetical protein